MATRKLRDRDMSTQHGSVGNADVLLDGAPNPYADDEQVAGQLALDEQARELVERRRTDGHRDGATYDARLDYDRLNAQARRVFDVMRDGMWHRLADIAQRTGDPEASISARLRDFRKQRFGALTVERQRAAGTWLYRLVVDE